MPINFPISFYRNLYEGAKWPFWCLRLLYFDGAEIGEADYDVTAVAKREMADHTAAKILAFKKTGAIVLADDWVTLGGNKYYYLDLRVSVKDSYVDYIRSVKIYVQKAVTVGAAGTGTNTSYPGVPVDWVLPIRINATTGSVEIVSEDNQAMQGEGNEQLNSEQ